MSHFKKCGHFFGQLLDVQFLENCGHLLYPFDVLVPDIHNVQQKSVSRQNTDIILAEYVRYDVMYRTLIMSTKCPTFGHSKCPTRSPLFLVKKYPLGVRFSDTLNVQKSVSLEKRTIYIFQAEYVQYSVMH